MKLKKFTTALPIYNEIASLEETIEKLKDHIKFSKTGEGAENIDADFIAPFFNRQPQKTRLYGEAFEKFVSKVVEQKENELKKLTIQFEEL